MLGTIYYKSLNIQEATAQIIIHSLNMMKLFALMDPGLKRGTTLSNPEMISNLLDS